MTEISEIAPELFRLSTYIPKMDLQFNQFLARDEEPLLFHTGLKKLFPAVHEAVGRLMNPSQLRWIGFSHFEADECGALDEWQRLAPNATALCSQVAKLVSVDDVAARPAKGLLDGEVLVTGQHRFRFLQTPHVPHAWDAGLLFEESEGTLLCSDLFHQAGSLEPITESDVVGRARQVLIDYQEGPFDHYLPYTKHTEKTLERLGKLKPRTLAIMHGSAFAGDGERALKDLARMLRDVLYET